MNASLLPLMSAADVRGHAWFFRWAELGNHLGNDAEGNLELGHRGDDESVKMLAEVNGDPLLRHAVARAFLNYLRWDYASDPDGTK